ncbi:hypothetical protein IQ260_18655 [Leptolyngbya cf. ectocarpi LEGE 11479]|uniref:Uncharacterized protein n=1 Tax=Leptolyngbya cf. ectocarpi LEGE 11479 TaxID=1828722 RepID=A0A928ZWG8_LEPEC|nr:hypothetical protein [Leptolyngbya ectocarpi]MBE9068670.1 hypothetical protein [Leptolyngbya cf. ectocarpi LEGE 11479]
MVNVRQLKLDLGGAFEDAADMPEEANILELWQQFEVVMTELPWREQLRMGGEVLARLAEICEAKSEVLWDDWQDANNSDGPVIDGDWLRGLTRQTQEIDFSELVQRSGTRSANGQDDIADNDSIVGEVDKEAVLSLVDELTMEEAKAKALSVSHAEDLSAWIAAITSVQGLFPLRLLDLQEQLQMPLIEVWIAALLGGFRLEQRGSFYDVEAVWLNLATESI